MDGSFSLEIVTAMSAAFGDALNKRELIDRDDPLAEIVARKIIEIARKGEHRPARLCSIALDADSGRSRPGFRHDAARHSDLKPPSVPR